MDARTPGIWTRLLAFLEGGATAVGGLLDRLAQKLGVDPVSRREFAFSAAMVALSAKMAKADGVVTRDEVAAFRRLFVVPPGEETKVNRLFDLARRDVAGYQAYAGQMAGLYPADDPMLEDILDGLFHIATADGFVHEAELAYLEDVARLFGLDARDFERAKARHMLPADGDPYLVLGVARGAGLDEIKRAYRRLAAENHPDRLIGHGVPAEFLAIANARLAAINAAYERIEFERGRRRR